MNGDFYTRKEVVEKLVQATQLPQPLVLRRFRHYVSKGFIHPSEKFGVGAGTRRLYSSLSILESVLVLLVGDYKEGEFLHHMNTLARMNKKMIETALKNEREQLWLVLDLHPEKLDVFRPMLLSFEETTKDMAETVKRHLNTRDRFLCLNLKRVLSRITW